MSDSEAYLAKKKWVFRKRGDELVVEICPICGNPGSHFSINRLMGIWRCVKCDERGNLFTLKKHCGDLEAPSKVAEAFGGEVSYDVVPREEVANLVNQLWNDPRALLWLHDRGLPDSIIRTYCLGVSYEADGHFITFPYFKDEKWVNVKYRSLPPSPKLYRVKTKHENPLYNCDSGLKYDDVVLTEGEIDCLSAIVMGLPNSVSLPQGAGNFSPDHWDSLVGCKRIYFVMDPDGAGRSGVQSVARRLGEDRCYDVKIPNGMDINDLLTKFGVEGGLKRLRACIEDSKPVGKGDIASVKGALHELEDHILRVGSVEEGFASPWPSVNRVCGLVAPGEVVLLQAIPKTGKTTFAQQWLSYLALEHHVPTLMYCLEMPLWRLAQSLVAGTTVKSRDSITTLEVKMTMLRYLTAPFYYGAIPKEWDFEHVREVVTYSVRRFGVQFICFDNLQLLCRSVQNVYQEQAAVSREFKKLAADLGIAILLVVQPRKMNTRVMPGMYDPKGASDIIADADGMLSIWRRPLHCSEEVVGDDQIQTAETESFGPETLVRVPASRYRPGGQVLLHFDGELATFSEVGDNSDESPHI